MRKIALEIASDKFEGLHELKPADIRQYLGSSGIFTRQVSGK